MKTNLEAESNNANTVLGAGFYLDCADDGRWLIKQGDKRYTAGYDKQKVQDLISRLNEAHRPNVEQGSDNEIFVCWNDHDKGQKCEWVCEIKTCT